MRYLHTIRRHSILKFHMKKKWINFDSYLDLQCNAENLRFREHQQEAKRCGLIKLYDWTLAEKINSADVFRFAPNYKKSKIHRWKG